MRLRRLKLTRYGRFTDFVIDFGERAEGGSDLHVIYGLNEAGKSTTLAGFLDLLFGIEDRSKYNFLHQYSAMEIGADLEFGGKCHQMRRVRPKAKSLLDAQGQPLNEGLLAGALSGLTREAYRMMFSLDDQTLEDGGNAILDSKGDLGELLFSASAGLAGLSKALTGVSGEADAIFRKRASSTEIAALKRRLMELKTARDAIDTQASTYAALVAELEKAKKAYAGALEEHGRLKVLQDDLGGLVRAAPLIDEYGRLSAELKDLAALPRPPGHWGAELPNLIDDDATLKTKLSGLDKQIERLRGELDNIVLDKAVLRLGDDIRALSSSSVRFLGAETDLPKRRSALAESRSKLAQLARSIAGDGRDADPDSLVVDVRRLGSLRGLLEKWSGIEMRVATTRTELDAAEMAASRAREDLELLDREHPLLGVERKAAIQAAVGAAKSQDLLVRRRIILAASIAKSHAAEEALRLIPWLGEPAALASAKIPSPEQIRDWRDALTALGRKREGHLQNRRDLDTGKAELRARIAAAEVGASLIDDDEASALRERRDQAWATHRSKQDAPTATAFEQLMRAVDVMSDGRLAAADRLAELRGLRRDRDVCDVKIGREASILSEIETEAAELAAHIRKASPIEGEIADAGIRDFIDRIEAWIGRRNKAVGAADERRSADLELAGIDGEIDQARSQLGEVLRTIGFVPDGLDLAALLQAADDLLAKDVSQAQTRAAAKKLVRDAEHSIETRKNSADAAERERQAWQDKWEQALAGTWFPDRADDHGAVRAIVDALAVLPGQIGERDELVRRITAMEADRAAFLADVEAIRLALEDDSPDVPPKAAATAFHERYQAAVNANDQHSAKDGEREELQKDHDAVVAEIAVHDARKTDLLNFFGVDDLKAVHACLEQCTRRDQLEGDRTKLESRILQETNSPTMEVAQERLAGSAVEARIREHEECKRQISDLDERLKSLYAAHSAASDRLAAIGGDDSVAKIDTERRTVMLEIEDRALRFLHLRTGALLAERALVDYREKHRGSMMWRASEAFRIMTRDAYTGLTTRPEKDREILIALSGRGGSKLASDMSKGARFQLYLALRLAGYEEFATVRQAVPFLADDIMETFDEPRSKEVLALFGKMSDLGQVIYFTHHRHLCDLAKEAVPQVRIHELPA